MGDAVRGYINELRYLQQFPIGKPLSFGKKKRIPTEPVQQAPVEQAPVKTLGTPKVAPKPIGPYSHLDPAVQKLLGVDAGVEQPREWFVPTGTTLGERPKVLPVEDQVAGKLLEAGIKNPMLQKNVLAGTLNIPQAINEQQQMDALEQKTLGEQAMALRNQEARLNELHGLTLALEQNRGLDRESAMREAINLNMQGVSAKDIIKSAEDVAEKNEKVQKELKQISKEFESTRAKKSKEFTEKNQKEYEKSEEAKLRRKLGKEKGLTGTELEAYVKGISGPKVEKAPELTQEVYHTTKRGLDTWFEGRDDRDAIVQAISNPDPAAKQVALEDFARFVREDPSMATFLDRVFAGLTPEQRGRALAEYALSLPARSKQIAYGKELRD